MCPLTRKKYLESATVGFSSRPVQKNWDMGTELALGERYPRPPPTTFLETKLCLGTYASLQDAFMGEGFPFADQVLSLRKTMDLTKVFGTRNHWDDHRCR